LALKVSTQERRQILADIYKIGRKLSHQQKEYMSKILVTGGAGFIGSHTTEELIKRGHTVTVLDDLSGGFVENISDSAHFVHGTINDDRLINKLFEQERFDYVYHLAAYAAEGLSHFIKRFNYENNLIGSINLIDAAINYEIKCFVFTSSIAVYGSSFELPMTEATPPHPEDSYGIAKLAIEQELIISKRMFDLNHIIFRPHNVYGERQNVGDKYRNVIAIFMNQLLQNKPMTIFGDGSQQRAFSYIRDVAPILAKSIDAPMAYNQVFNIGADQVHTVKELAEMVARVMGTEEKVVYLPAREEVLNAYSLHTKIAEVFGEQSLYSLPEGLSNMASWVKRYGARTSKKFESIEIMKNFPSDWL
jgi:UDP-glucose 4-epimerase